MFASVRRLAFPSLAAALFLATPAAALDGPTMSRYLHQVPAATTVANLDQAVVETLCRDEDGCEVILRMESPIAANGNVADDWIVSTSFGLTLSRSFDHTSWSKGAGFFLDSNGTVETLASIAHLAAPTCTLNDGDGPTASVDTGLGFSLVLSSAGAGVCTIVIID